MLPRLCQLCSRSYKGTEGREGWYMFDVVYALPVAKSLKLKSHPAVFSVVLATLHFQYLGPLLSSAPYAPFSGLLVAACAWQRRSATNQRRTTVSDLDGVPGRAPGVKVVQFHARWVRRPHQEDGRICLTQVGYDGQGHVEEWFT